MGVNMCISGLRFSLWRIPLAYSTSLWHQWSLYKLGIHDPFTGFLGQHLQHSLWYPSFPSPSFLYLFYIFFQQIFFHLWSPLISITQTDPGKIFDSHSIILPDGTRQCFESIHCYSVAYWVTFGASLLAVFLSLWSIRHDNATTAKAIKLERGRDVARDAWEIPVSQGVWGGGSGGFQVFGNNLSARISTYIRFLIDGNHRIIKQHRPRVWFCAWGIMY